MAGRPLSSDFEAEYDAETLMRAEEIKKDSARLGRARGWAEHKRDEMDRMAKTMPGRPNKVPNGAVRGSRMAPKEKRK